MDVEWPVSTPIEQGFNPEGLSQVEKMSAELDNIFALLVIRNGFIISENYYNGKSAETANHIRSITKCFLSPLIGIAIEKGFVESVNKNVLHYFPEYKESRMDSRKNEITIEHLMTMRTGFLFNEDEEIRKWIFDGKFSAEYDALKRKIQSQPGKIFNYDTPSVDLLSVILTKTTKQDTFSFAKDELFRPLGIENTEWERDPANYYRGGTGLVMRPRDVAKLGQLYLQKGKWRGHQIVSENWVEQSIIPYSKFKHGKGYCRLWWTRKTDKENLFFGWGYGGQYLIVAPKKELIVVTNTEWNLPSEQARKQESFLLELFSEIYKNVH